MCPLCVLLWNQLHPFRDLGASSTLVLFSHFVGFICRGFDSEGVEVVRPYTPTTLDSDLGHFELVVKVGFSLYLLLSSHYVPETLFLPRSDSIDTGSLFPVTMSLWTCIIWTRNPIMGKLCSCMKICSIFHKLFIKGGFKGLLNQPHTR